MDLSTDKIYEITYERYREVLAIYGPPLHEERNHSAWVYWWKEFVVYEMANKYFYQKF